MQVIPGKIFATYPPWLSLPALSLHSFREPENMQSSTVLPVLPMVLSDTSITLLLFGLGD